MSALDVAPFAITAPPEPATEDGDVHLRCCRRPDMTLCGQGDTVPGPGGEEITCSFCRACEEEDDTCADSGMTIRCQIDNLPCPEQYQP